MATQPDNWEAIKALFDAALELDSSTRSTFLRNNCSDAEVRTEVERLLNEHDQAGGFISTPVWGHSPLEAEAPTPTRRLSVGQVLAGRFQIVRFIADGGMGEVYEAEDQELREHVAVKVIRSEIFAQPNAVARFKREVHLARKITHPNICRIFDLFRHKPDGGSGQEETSFISMELLCGKTLGSRLKEGGRMSMAEALPLVQQMTSALAAAHAVGIVHRDFKPDNVVLVPCEDSPTGVRAVVTDFGLALRSVSTAASSSSTTLSLTCDFSGTPAYMAPEQIEGRPSTTASDIYALGLVMYEMVTGERPFMGDTPISAALKRLSHAPVPPRTFQPELSSVWEKVILRCLERDPSKRFAKVQDVCFGLTTQHSESALSDIEGLTERQARVLEAAAPRESRVGTSTEVVTMVRRSESRGLRGYLDSEGTSSLTSEDVREKHFELEFALDANGHARPAEICLKLESPDFEPRTQTKKLRVPPRGDSASLTFLITPRIAGNLVVNLELLERSEVVATRSIRMRALTESEPIAWGNNIVSIPFTILVQLGSAENELRIEASKPGEFTSLFLGPFRGDKPSPEVSPQKIEPPGKTGGDFTTIFGTVKRQSSEESLAASPPPMLKKPPKVAIPEPHVTYWPLVLTLAVLFSIAVLLVLYFVLKH